MEQLVTQRLPKLTVAAPQLPRKERNALNRERYIIAQWPTGKSCSWSDIVLKARKPAPADS
jgi:hypothetical protein